MLFSLMASYNARVMIYSNITLKIFHCDQNLMEKNVDYNSGIRNRILKKMNSDRIMKIFEV